METRAERRREDAPQPHPLESANLLARLTAERRELRREIKELEDQVRMQGQALAAVDLDAVVHQLLGQSLAAFSPAAQLADTPGVPISPQQLDTLATVTGLSFSKVGFTWLAAGPERARHYTVIGAAYELQFELVFDVSDAKLDLLAVQAHVAGQAGVELASLCRIAATARSPQLFLRGFVQYAEWRLQRQQLFAALRQQHPDFVTLPNGDGGRVLGMATPAGSLMLHWRFVVDRDGNVNTTFDLAPFQPTPTAAFVLAAEGFHTLLLAKGVEGGIRAIADSVARQWAAAAAAAHGE